jgi:drug/metabolite transporter (DMT)-like permease
VKSRTADALLFLAAILWGGTFLTTKFALMDANPLLVLFGRFVVSVGFILALRPRHLLEPEVMRKGLILGVFLFLSYAAQTLSLLSTSIARSGFITYSFALLVPPLQFLVTGKRLRLGNLLGLGFVVSGYFAFSGQGALGGFNTGDLYALAAAFGYATLILLLDRFNIKDRDVELSFYQFSLTALLSLILAASIPGGLSVTFTPRFVGSIAYLGILGSGLCLWIITKYQARTTPTRAVVIYSLEPVVAAVLALLVLAERPSTREIVGIVLILGGVLISETWPVAREKLDDARGRG